MNSWLLGITAVGLVLGAFWCWLTLTLISFGARKAEEIALMLLDRYVQARLKVSQEYERVLSRDKYTA